MKRGAVIPSILEWISFAVTMPFVCLMLQHLLFGNRLFNEWSIWLLSFPITAVLVLLVWYAGISVMHRLRTLYPKISQTGKRLLLLALAQIFITGSAIVGLFLFYDSNGFLGYSWNPSHFYSALYVGISLSMITTAMWESHYTLQQFKGSLAEKEELERLTMRQEFETLKSQVNPHFLFNCFNTLSSLISEDRKQAEVFLNELSKVYRYLLRNNEDGLSTLRTELGFIQSYFELLRTRHGVAVELTIETDKKYDNYLLPSLSLQMLVENAVKHNVLSKNKPLSIDIFTTSGNRLVVSNNLQLRAVKAPSNRIGLDNIRSKYELLNHGGFQVLQDKKTFSVVLPLIWNKALHTSMTPTETN